MDQSNSCIFSNKNQFPNAGLRLVKVEIVDRGRIIVDHLVEFIISTICSRMSRVKCHVCTNCMRATSRSLIATWKTKILCCHSDATVVFCHNKWHIRVQHASQNYFRLFRRDSIWSKIIFGEIISIRIYFMSAFDSMPTSFGVGFSSLLLTTFRNLGFFDPCRLNASNKIVWRKYNFDKVNIRRKESFDLSQLLCSPPCFPVKCSFASQTI